MGGGCATGGQRRRRLEISFRLRVSDRAGQPAHPERPGREDHFQIQGQRRSAVAHLGAARDGVPAPLSPTRPAQRFSARPLLRLAESRRQNPMGTHSGPAGLEAGPPPGLSGPAAALSALFRPSDLDREPPPRPAAATARMNFPPGRAVDAQRNKPLWVTAPCCRASEKEEVLPALTSFPLAKQECHRADRGWPALWTRPSATVRHKTT